MVGDDSLPMPQEDLLSHLREIAEEGPEPETFTESMYKTIILKSCIGESNVCIFKQLDIHIILVPMNIPCLLPRASRQNSVKANMDDEDQDLESSISQDNEDTNEGDTTNTDGTDYQKVLRLLEEGDKVRSFRCFKVMQSEEYSFFFKVDSLST